MKPRTTIAVLVAAGFAFLLTPNRAEAAGFAVAEQGAGAIAVGGAATARGDLASSGYYNPAAMRVGFKALLGGSFIVPRLFHESPDGVRTQTDSGPATPPFAHVGWMGQFGKHRVGAVAVGNVPFGAGLSWPDDWAGRFEITDIELQVFESSASLVYSYELDREATVGVAATIRGMRSTVELRRKIDAVESEASVRLGGVSNTLAGGAALYGALGRLALGVSYRSAATLDFEGAAHFEDVPPELSGAAQDQGVMTTVNLPERIAVGTAVYLRKGTVSLDLEHFRWSRFETFAIDFEREETPDVVQPRNWNNTWTWRAGYEHRLIEDQLAARVGFAFDPTPSPPETLSPTLPDSSRIILSTGLGYTFGFGMTVDLAYAHIALLGSEATGDDALPGKVGGQADLVSLGVSFRR